MGEGKTKRFMGLFGNKKKKTSALASSLQSEKVKSDIIVSTIEDGVIFIDDKKTIQLFNPAAARI